MRPLIWIIDTEWPDYEIEKAILARELPGCELKFSGHDFETDLVNFGKRADAIICQIDINLTAAVIAQLEQCKVISVYGVGYDRIDLAGARKRQIAVTNVPGYCNEDLSDYVIAGIYYFNKQLGCWDRAIKDGLWGAQAVANPVKRVGKSSLFLIGFGKIGRQTAQKAKALQMRVMAYSPNLTPEIAGQYQVESVTWDYGLANADFVSVHTPLTDSTRGLLDYEAFCKMKPAAYFINTSRGGVVKQDDLLRAVRERRIAGAMLDVLETEPPGSDHPILHCDRIVVTPHISYLSTEALDELKSRAAENAAKVLKDDPTADLVPECRG